MMNVKNNYVISGGVYCANIAEQARVLQSLASKKKLVQFLQMYTEDSVVNRFLRAHSEVPCGYQQEANAIISSLFHMFNKMPKYNPPTYTMLYRGVDVDYDEAVNDCGFMSTSTRIEVAKKFGKNVMRIFLLHGYQYSMLPLEYITVASGEYEVVLAPGRGHFFQCSYAKEDGVGSSRIIADFVYIPKDINGNLAQHNYKDGKIVDNGRVLNAHISTVVEDRANIQTYSRSIKSFMCKVGKNKVLPL